MKRKISVLFVLCACLMMACGNSAIDEINQLVVDATEQTLAATTAEEVAEIANNLQAEMERIATEAGDKITFGADIDEALTDYQEAASAKLAEFGLEL